LFESEGENSSFLVNLAALFDAGFPELRGPLNDLKPIAETLEGLGYGLRISAMLVRNFEYYTGPVFQLWSGQRQLGAGGRYDDLVRLSGAAPVPASGIALDLQALLDILGDQDGQSTYRSIAVVASGGSPDQMAMAFQTASRLVEKGWQAHVSTESNGADQAGWRLLIDRADAALIFRVHDIEGGSWRVFRDLDSAIAHLAGAAS
jgi:histidyl-tRNA synthetase